MILLAPEPGAYPPRLAIYAEKMGYALDEIAAIGDQMIDIPMLKLAGLSAPAPKSEPRRTWLPHPMTRPGSPGSLSRFCKAG